MASLASQYLLAKRNMRRNAADETTHQEPPPYTTNEAGHPKEAYYDQVYNDQAYHDTDFPRDHSHDLPHCNPYDFIAASQPTSRSPQRTPQRTPQHSPHALFNSPSPRTYNPQSETPPPLTVAAFTKLAASHPFPTMTPPPPTCIDDLTTQILAEIRTAGLRKGRENALIQLLTELKQETRAHVEGCGRAVREYAVFAEGVVSARNLAGRKWEALEGVVNGLKGKESKMAELARQQAGRAEEEIEELKQQVKLMEVAHTTEKEQMDVQFLAKMKKEISRVKESVKKDASKRAIKCVEGVEMEYRGKVGDLKSQLGALTEANGEMAAANGELEKKVAEQAAAMDRLEGFRREMEEEYDGGREESETALRSAYGESEELLRENNELRARIAVVEEECGEEVANVKEKRRVDLQNVEERVKEVMAKKAFVIEGERARAERAEGRAAQLEKMLNALNDGFELVEEGDE